MMEPRDSMWESEVFGSLTLSAGEAAGRGVSLGRPRGGVHFEFIESKTSWRYF